MEKKLVIVSDTHMWEKEGKVYVFEPTLREVEHLATVFSEILWLGFYHGEEPASYARPDKTGKIKFKLLPCARGGASFWNKLKIIPFIPSLVFSIISAIRQGEVVHTRGPSVPALVGILISYFYSKKVFWHKYAGNWVQENPPLSYAIQRFLLKRLSKHFITVNGKWQGDRSNVLSFENPCFSEAELQHALEKASKKNFTGQLTLLFVGRVEHEKGIIMLLNAMKILPPDLTSKIERLIVVGHGKDWDEAVKLADLATIPVEFKGQVQRDELNVIYSSSHVLMLPSKASEGFPKVVAEASAFGCLPFVSSVSAINHYVVNGENGIVLKEISKEEIITQLSKLADNRDQLKQLSMRAPSIAQKFTYERYNQKVETEILAG